MPQRRAYGSAPQVRELMVRVAGYGSGRQLKGCDAGPRIRDKEVRGFCGGAADGEKKRPRRECLEKDSWKST